MPIFSAFTPYGQLEFSSKTPTAARVFDGMRRSLGRNFSERTGPEDTTMARVYAWARMFARVRQELRRAGNEHDPARTLELLPVNERAHGLVPEAKETLASRRARLSVRWRVPRGPVFEHVKNVMELLLGDEFVAYRPLRSDGASFPVTPSASGTFVSDGTLPGSYVTESSIAFPGTPEVVQYRNGDGSRAEPRLAVGDKVVVDGDKDGLRETVTVTAVTEIVIPFVGAFDYFTATFAHSHDPTAPVTSVFPFWGTTKKHNLFVVSDAARPDLRRRVDEEAHRLLTGVSTWDVTEETTPGSGVTGPFQVGIGKIGITTIGAIAI